MSEQDSYGTKTELEVQGGKVSIRSLAALERQGFHEVMRLPYSLKILLENLLRHEDGRFVSEADISALASWDVESKTQKEITFMPSRVLLQDFTGVPAVVDLAAMRDGIVALGGDPGLVNPLQPVELVIDHSVQVDHYGVPDAVSLNAALEFERNRERYAFLRWGQTAFENFRVVPPGAGIVHQVNLEYLARVVVRSGDSDVPMAYPDTLVGTDSHTTMVNGLGVVGWGVGGIEAEAAMLGQPISMLIPEVLGFRLGGRLPEGTTATDLVLTITECLRKEGVVGKFVEFFGPGLEYLTIADRATLGNMSPEYGSTIAIFPIDHFTLDYLRLTGRDQEQIDLVERYAKAQGLFHSDESVDSSYSRTIEFDLSVVEASLAGPKRPQDRVPLSQAKSRFTEVLESMKSGQHSAVSGSTFERLPAIVSAASTNGTNGLDSVESSSVDVGLADGAVVVAAITSCTNTSNPSVMIGAGLLARKAVERGLQVRPWVKTSLAPGSQVVTEYLKQAGLMDALDLLGFGVVGYGCTTCIGNSGPLPDEVSQAIRDRDLVVASVLSGNRNFEGRIHSEVRTNYLASPLLVVAYALAGSMRVDLTSEPLGLGSDGQPVFLRELWPTGQEIQETMLSAVQAEMFKEKYAAVFEGDERWRALPTPAGDRFEWVSDSTYIRNPPFFEGMTKEPLPLTDIRHARVLALLGDSVTTDHISPAGSIPIDSPAGTYLISNGVEPGDFNSYGARRGNHEVMMRGTFANIRLRNKLAPETEGGWTVSFPGSEVVTIYEAAMRYQADGVPLVVLAGKEYGAGSSRDWAAKGTRLLGVRAVIAESFERIHRSNLVNMGVLPLEYEDGKSADTLALTGRETLDFIGVADNLKPRSALNVRVCREDGDTFEFRTAVRIDTPEELESFRHGGILQYVLRQLVG